MIGQWTMRWMAAVMVCAWGSALWGQEVPAGGKPENAPSRMVAVTVYQNSALVTRQVSVPEGTGAIELVVGPLPTSTVGTSLFSEGLEGVRVLTTRYRTRALEQVEQEEQRKIEAKLKELTKENQQLQSKLSVTQENLRLMGKMEDFTGASLKQMTDKGHLDSKSIAEITQFIMKTRAEGSNDSMELQQQIEKNNEQQQFLQRQLSRISGASDKTVREAVIVVDKSVAGAAQVKLNYLVSAASWHLQYRLRAAKDKPEAQLEYLGVISQRSGEDWGNVELVLSMAQPAFNAAPPDLTALEVSTGGAIQRVTEQVQAAKAQQLRKEAIVLYGANSYSGATSVLNGAAALEQSNEYLYAREARVDLRSKKANPAKEGQNIAFRLPARLSIPWRDDEQLIEVVRVSLKPDYFYKAVPVLTEHVYRLANLVNSSEHVILPGEVTIYVGTDFVGRTDLPLVAVGEQFTVGFGVDPQLQVQRTLVEKSRSTSWGGDQTFKYEYRLAVSSYKNEPVRMQVMDRVPYP